MAVAPIAMNATTVDQARSKVSPYTVFVDGHGQGVRQGFPQGRGSMRAGVVSDACVYVVGSAAKAYETTPLDVFDRSVVALPDQYYLMIDTLAAPESHVYDWRLGAGSGTDYLIDGAHFPLGNSRVGRVVDQWNNSAQLRLTLLDDQPRTITLAPYDGAEEYGQQLHVSSGAPAREAEIMTLLQAGARNTPGLLQAETLPMVTSGPGSRNLSISGATVVFLRSTAVGDWVEFTIDLPESGSYDVRFWFGTSPSYAQLRLSIDGEPLGSVVDTYRSEITLLDAVSFGSLSLTAGTHKVRLTVTGHNASSAGYFISVDAFQIVRTGTPVDPQPLPTLAARRVISDTAVGAVVTRPAGERSLTDVIGLRTGAASAVLEGVRTDAEQFLVAFDRGPAVERYALTRATSAIARARRLLACTSAVDLGVLHHDEATLVTITTPVDQAVSFHVRTATMVTVNGEPAGVQFDAGRQVLTMTLAAGTHQVVVT
ncbi:carbohydrate-binding protein [Propionibacteriaceae bacterium Y2011]